MKFEKRNNTWRCEYLGQVYVCSSLMECIQAIEQRNNMKAGSILNTHQ